MQMVPDIKKETVERFAESTFAAGNSVRSDDYGSYIPALTNFTHEHTPYDPNAEMLHWLHIAISNAKAFILGSYHGLSKKNLHSYLDEYCFRFCRRSFGPELLERLTFAIGTFVRLS